MCLPGFVMVCRLFERGQFLRHNPIGEADVVHVKLHKTHGRRRLALEVQHANDCVQLRHYGQRKVVDTLSDVAETTVILGNDRACLIRWPRRLGAQTGRPHPRWTEESPSARAEQPWS